MHVFCGDAVGEAGLGKMCWCPGCVMEDGEEDVDEDDCCVNSCDDMEDGRDEKEDDMEGGGEKDGGLDLL